MNNTTNVAKLPEKELPPKMGAIAAGGGIKAIVPHTLDDVFRLAKMVMAAKLAPKTLETEEKVTIAMLHGLEVGLPPMMSLQSIAVIGGRPTIWGDGAMALVLASGLLENIDETIDGDGERMIARCTVKRVGRKPRTHEFSVGDAMKAGLWNKEGPWRNYPRRMIAMRPRSWCLRDEFADILKGLGIAEEVMDTEMRDITPVPTPPAPPPEEGETLDLRPAAHNTDAPVTMSLIDKDRNASPPITLKHPSGETVKAGDLVPEKTYEVDKATGVVIDPDQLDLPDVLKRKKEAPEVIASGQTLSPEQLVADWQDRLRAADRNTQEEIFESEIEPYREHGGLSPEQYNSLVALIKDSDRGEAQG